MTTQGRPDGGTPGGAAHTPWRRYLAAVLIGAVVTVLWIAVLMMAGTPRLGLVAFLLGGLGAAWVLGRGRETSPRLVEHLLVPAVATATAGVVLILPTLGPGELHWLMVPVVAGQGATAGFFVWLIRSGRWKGRTTT